MIARTQNDFARRQARAVYRAKGRSFEDFHLGQSFDHHWARTFTDADTIEFSTQTLHYNPVYFSLTHAGIAGHSRLVINPYLVLSTAIGLSVEDLSEAGGPFVGIDDVRFLRSLLVGDTITACSETIDLRESQSKPTYGIVTWRTQALTQDGHIALSFVRSNLVMKRQARRQLLEAALGHDRIDEGT